MEKNNRKITVTTIILLALCLGGICYSLWYFLTGWDKQNAIMAYCSTLNHTELGWFKYVCGHGALNFIAGWAAIYFIASPILIIVFYFLKKNNINKAVTTLFGALITSVIMVALTVMIIYSGLYMMAEHPIISGLIILVGALVGLSSCYTVVQIVVVIEK